MALRAIKLKKYKGIYELTSSQGITGYYVSYRDANAKPQKHRVDASDRDEALLMLNQIKAQVKRDKQRSDSTTNLNMSINDLAEVFFDAKKSARNNRKDRHNYKNHLSALGKLKARDLKPMHIQRLQSELVDTLAAKTVNNLTNLLRSIMRFAVANQYVPADTYKLEGYTPLQVDNINEFVLSPQQVRGIIDSVTQPRTKLFLAMAYYTAQRPESLLRLQKKDIEEDKIRFSAIKKQKSHSISIHAELAPLLNDWIKDLDEDDFIFHGQMGKHKAISYGVLHRNVTDIFDQFNRRFYYKEGLSSEELKAAKSRAFKEHRKQWASLYTLRHSAATHILSSTGNIALASSVLNHSDLRMTQRYAKIADTQKKEAIDVL